VNAALDVALKVVHKLALKVYLSVNRKVIGVQFRPGSTLL
jgi:hypothetical protein